MTQRRLWVSVLVNVGVWLGVWLAAPTAARAQTLTLSMNEAKKALADALALDQQGKYKEARIQYLRAIRLNPHGEEAFEQYAMFLYTRGKYKEGAKALRIGLKLNPGMKLLGAYLGMHLFRLGRVGEAFLRLKSAESTFRDKFALQAIFAQCAMVIEEYEAAARAIRRYLETRPASLSGKDFAFRVQLSLALMRSGALRAAEQQVNQVLDDRPDSIQAMVAKAELKLLKGRCAEALEGYRQILPRVKSDHLALYIGKAYLCMRRFQDAQNVAEGYLVRRQAPLGRLLAKPPTRGERYTRTVRYLRMALLLRGDAGMRLKQYNGALEDYKKASVLTGGAEQVELKVAGAHYELKEYSKTLEKLVEPLKRTEADPEVLVLAVRAAIRTKDTALALKCADRLVRSKGATANHLYFGAMAYNSAGRFTEAANLLERALVIDPKHRGCQRELVRAYALQAKRSIRIKQLPQAEALLTKALRLEPRTLRLRRDLALVMLKQGRSQEALTQAELAVNINPKDSGAQRLAGRALAQAGKHSKALAYFTRALKDRPPGPETARILVESAASRMAEGATTQGLAELEQAAKMVQRNEKHEKLAAVIQRNIVRGHLMRGGQQLDRGLDNAAWKDFSTALKQINLLPKAERPAVQASAIFAAIASGNQTQARKLTHEYRNTLGDALVPAYKGVAQELLAAYADFSAGAAAVKLRGANRLEKLAARVLPAGQDKLRDMAGSAYAQAAESYFRYGKARQSAVNLGKARRLLRAVPAEVRHNTAVAEYYSGRRDDALRTLQAVSGKVAVALCNLAVFHEEKGVNIKAYELFSQCEQRGGRFPGLKAILEIKRQIFGKAPTKTKEK